MKDELISFPTAKLAKEKGFDLESESYYNSEGDLLTDTDFPSLQPTKFGIWYSAPSQSLLQKWFRETHNIGIAIRSHFNGVTNYKVYKTTDPFIEFTGKDRIYGTYEEALEKGLFEALNLI